MTVTSSNASSVILIAQILYILDLCRICFKGQKQRSFSYTPYIGFMLKHLETPMFWELF